MRISAPRTSNCCAGFCAGRRSFAGFVGSAAARPGGGRGRGIDERPIDLGFEQPGDAAELRRNDHHAAAALLGLVFEDPRHEPLQLPVVAGCCRRSARRSGLLDWREKGKNLVGGDRADLVVTDRGLADDRRAVLAVGDRLEAELPRPLGVVLVARVVGQVPLHPAGPQGHERARSVPLARRVVEPTAVHEQPAARRAYGDRVAANFEQPHARARAFGRRRARRAVGLRGGGWFGFEVGRQQLAVELIEFAFAGGAKDVHLVVEGGRVALGVVRERSLAGDVDGRFARPGRRRRRRGWRQGSPAQLELHLHVALQLEQLDRARPARCCPPPGRPAPR